MTLEQPIRVHDVMNQKQMLEFIVTKNMRSLIIPR